MWSQIRVTAPMKRTEKPERSFDDNRIAVYQEKGLRREEL